MKIVAIDVCPLTGGTVDGGWPQGHEPQEDLHALVVVRTDQGLEGFGSCYTSGKLVAGAIGLLWPLFFSAPPAIHRYISRAHYGADGAGSHPRFLHQHTV